MALYEAGYIEESFYALDAFKSFLKKTKGISGENIAGFNNFIKYYARILRHKYKKEEPELNSLLQEVRNSDTDNQNWFVEKIEELKNSNRDY